MVLFIEYVLSKDNIMVDQNIINIESNNITIEVGNTPTYTIDIPTRGARGIQGEKGDTGEVSQAELDAAMATVYTKTATDTLLSSKYDSTNFVAGTNYVAPTTFRYKSCL